MNNKRSVKVLINALSARRGGGQTYLVNLLDNIDAVENIDVILLLSDDFVTTQNQRILKIIAPKATSNPIIRAVWEFLNIPLLINKYNVDVLYCPGGLVNVLFTNKCYIVTMFQNMIPFMPAIRCQYSYGWQRIRNWILEHLLLFSMSRSDIVIFISEYAKSVIRKRLHNQINKAIVIPHGINDTFRHIYNSKPHRPDWLFNSDYLLYVSIFEPYKNHLEVVRGFYKLKTLRSTTEKLLLVGKNDLPAGFKVKEEIARLGLQDDVIMVGNIAYSELPALYYNAKINIFASTCENCPNIMLEALGSGRPLLVSNVPPMTEFGDSAVAYFDPTSPDDIASQLLAIIDSPQQLCSLGNKAFKQSEMFDIRSAATLTWRAIQQLVINDKNIL